MGNQPSQQLLLFAQSILLGLSAGLLYDLLRSFRLKLPRMTHVLDGIFCLICAAVLFLFVLERGDGELRGFMILGSAGGMILFFGVFAEWLRPIWQFWVDNLLFLVYLLSVPTRFAKKFCKKAARTGKNLFYFAGKYYTINKTSTSNLVETHLPFVLL